MLTLPWPDRYRTDSGDPSGVRHVHVLLMGGNRMKAVHVVKPGEIAVAELPVPSPRAGETILVV